MIAVLDCRTPEPIAKALFHYGYSPLRLPPHPKLPRAIATHPDMLLFFAHDRILCTEDYAQIAKEELKMISEASQKKICTVAQAVGSSYPKDILLNAACIGKTLLCLAEHTASELTQDTYYTLCNTRQGYAKCSTVPVGENALITADPAIAKAACKMGLELLQIRHEQIRLDGYNTGFLGGASSYAPYRDLQEIYFCGNLSTHFDAPRIIEFCQKHQKEAISLSDAPLMDLGTVFLI